MFAGKALVGGIVALALAIPIARADDASGLSADDARRVEAGEIVVSSHEVAGWSLPKSVVVAVIQAPPDEVWAIVENCARYTETMPRVLESREIERNGNRVHCKATIDMPFPFSDLVAETDAVHTVVPGQSYKREWTHRGGDFKANEGSWTLVPRADGKSTLATYAALMEPNVPIPAWILRWAQEVSLPSMMEGLRKQLTKP